MPTRQLALCPHCDWVTTLPPAIAGHSIHCPRCNQVLKNHIKARPNRFLPWAIAALATLVLVFFFDFLGFSANGIGQTISFTDTLVTLVDHQYWFLAAVFIMTTAILPGIYLLSAIYIGLAVSSQNCPSANFPGVIYAARAAQGIQGWMMSDVFIIGVLIGLTKIISLAEISFGTGFFEFCGFSLLLLKTTNALDWAHIWPAIAGDAPLPKNIQPEKTGRQQNLGLCTTCQAPIALSGSLVCARCGRGHWLRHHNRIQMTWALLVSALMLYVPANVYPIMSTSSLTKDQDQTIAGGVLQLIAIGSWPIAVIIFVASIIIPLFKILALGWLCICSKRKVIDNTKALSRLYRFTEFIGRWSMIDVFVVSVTAALVQAGIFMSVSPGPAVIPFAIVVIMTMIAAKIFDTRLIWSH